ncbi:hypothetical protein MRB53_007928 [Persea americana]|uniref:Uncharacterized protein n=1 Tax=Persea americana TaxID=3435 RepID=A0ACC2MKC8_PERAE|nr:hypothetical protein MRB53_007928 [Persea americana]
MYGDTPKYDYEFQEWWKRVRERNVITFVNPTPSLDQTVKKKPSCNAGHGCLLKFQQAVTRVASYNGLIEELCRILLLLLFLFLFLFYRLAVYFYGKDFDGGLASPVPGKDKLRPTNWLAVDLMDHVLV